MMDSGTVRVMEAATVPSMLVPLLPRVRITTTVEVMDVSVVLGVMVVLTPV